MVKEFTSVGCPTISIIIPIYNAFFFIKECLESIISQDYMEWEVLLVDDGSTDDSRVICEEYEKYDTRIRYYHKPNGGVSSARNLGIQHARGKWVTFVDADDILPNAALSNLMSFTSPRSVQLVVAGYDMFTADGGVYYSTLSSCEQVIIRTRASSITQMYLNAFWPWFMCSKLFSRDVIESCGLLFDETVKYCEDKLFVTSYMCAIDGNVVFSSIPVYRYRTHAESAEGKVKYIYNEGKLTGFVASVKTYNLLQEAKLDSMSKRLALNDFVNSYRVNLRMLKECGLKDSKYKKEIDRLFFEAVPVFQYVLFIVGRKVCSFFSTFRVRDLILRK